MDFFCQRAAAAFLAHSWRCCLVELSMRACAPLRPIRLKKRTVNTMLGAAPFHEWCQLALDPERFVLAGIPVGQERLGAGEAHAGAAATHAHYSNSGNSRHRDSACTVRRICTYKSRTAKRASPGGACTRPFSKRVSRPRLLAKVSARLACSDRCVGRTNALTLSGGTGSLIQDTGARSLAISSNRRGQ